MIAPIRNVFLGLAGIMAFGLILGPIAPAGEDKAAEIKVTPVSWKGYLEKVASRKDAKLVVVDAWATWCVPCMKNFPHLVEMHEKYASKGLVAMSLSLDEADMPKKVAKVNAFLKEKKADFPNMILEERLDDGLEKLKINGIPAVFIYSPDGKEIKRFTGDDVDHIFTYEQVEEFIKDYLAKHGEAASKL